MSNDLSRMDLEGRDDLNVRSLLHYAVSSPRRPVDDVLDAFIDPSEEPRVFKELARHLGCDVQAMLLDPSTELSAIQDIKDRSKDLNTQAGQRVLALVGYFFALAAGLAHHGKKLTQRSCEELEPIYRDLRGVVPDVWVPVLTRAIGRL